MEEGSGPVSDLMVWAKSHGAGLPSERAEVRAKALEPGTWEGTVKHPFPVADRQKYLDAVRMKGIAKRSLNAPVGRIQLSALKGIQTSVNQERLMQHLKDPRLVPDGTRAPGHGMLIDLPVIVKTGGEYYVHDGTHRASAAHLRGEKDLKCRLVDLDADDVQK